MATTLRFIILGDDRASAGFNKFARSVEKANGQIDRNSKALQSQSKTSAVADSALANLIGTVTGFGDAQDAAYRKTSIFARGLAAVNVATGILEPAMAGVVVAAGGLAAAFAAAAAGAVAYKVALTPLLAETQTVTQAQKQLQQAQKTAQANYQAAIKSGTSAQQAAKARQQALTVATQRYNQAVKAVPPVVRQFAKEVKAAKDAWTAWANRLAKPVLQPLQLGLSFIHRALSAIRPLVLAAADAFAQLTGEIGVKIQGGGLERLVTTILPHVKPTILDLGHAIGNVATGVFGILKAFLPVSNQITGGVVHLTRLFKDWASALPTHTGFQSLMDTFRKTTPLVIPVLKNLAVIIKNVAAAMTGLATPANSRALLQILTPLTAIVAKLSENQNLVRAVFYFVLLRKTFGQLALVTAPLVAGVKLLTSGELAASAVGKAWAVQLAAQKIALIASAVATRVMTAAQWLLNVALDANPIGIIIGLLVAFGAAIYLAWKKSATFRKILIQAWKDIKATALAVWHWFTGPFVRFFTDTLPHVFKSVLDWIKHNWPWILGALTGPIGLAIVWIIRHWDTFRHTLASIYDRIRHDIASVWDTIWRNTVTRVRNGIADVVNRFKGLPGRAIHALTGLGTMLYNFGHQALTKLWNGMKAVYHSVISWFAGLPKAILHAIGINSPPNWAIEAGKHIMGGLLHGIISRKKELVGAWGGAIGALGGPTSAGARQAQAYARGRLSAYGWTGAEMGALIALWNGESGWNRLARNPSSGAYGIPQALPPSKMGPAANPPTSSAAAQINWGLGYIKSVYGSPSAAYAAWLSRSPHWYDQGGWLPPGLSLAMNQTGQPERVLSPRESAGVTHITYNVNIQVPVGANQAQMGRQFVHAIQQYEKSSGNRWRK